MFAPEIIGWEAGTVCPAGMVTVPGEILTLLESLLCSVMVTGEDGAADSATAIGAVWPNARVAVLGKVTDPAAATVTFRVVSGMPVAEAWITALPAVPPVTGTFTLVEFAGNLTVAGTLATLGVVEESETVRPEFGAGPDSVSAMFDVPAPVIASDG